MFGIMVYIENYENELKAYWVSSKNPMSISSNTIVVFDSRVAARDYIDSHVKEEIQHKFSIREIRL